MFFLSRLKQWIFGKSSEVPVQVQQPSTATPQPASTTASQPTTTKPKFPPKNKQFLDETCGQYFTIKRVRQVVFEDQVSTAVEYDNGGEPHDDSYDLFQSLCTFFSKVPWKDFYDFYK